MIASLSFSGVGFASMPKDRHEQCPPEAKDLLTYITGHDAAASVLTTVLHMADHTTPAATVMAEVMANLKPIGSHTAHICEATDILFADPPMQPVDGESGDTSYPYGSIKDGHGRRVPAFHGMCAAPSPLRPLRPSPTSPF